MFEKIVSKWIDIPITAKFLSMSEYVDAIIVIVDSSLAKGNNAYSVATMQGIMDIELHSYVPIVFRSICTTNCYNLPSASSYHIGKTAVEMALARWEALDAIAEFGQVERESGFVGSLIIVILVLVLVGFIVKKRGINVDKGIFSKTVCCRKEYYDKVEATTPVVNAEIA